MDLQYLLLENPLKLYLVLALIEIILGACWYARRARAMLYAMIAPAVLGVTIGLVAHFVVTDREKIAAAMDEIGNGVCHGCLVPASHYIDANYRVPLPLGGSLDRDQLLAMAQTAIQEHRITDISFHDIDTKVAGANATTLVGTRLTLNEGMFDVSWRLQWAKRPDGWRIVRVEITRPEHLWG
jgi:hypothetical protein